MKQCEYIYANGLRFDSGRLFVDVVCDDGVLRRLAVIRNGHGAARTGEITLKDLDTRSIGQETVVAFVKTASGLEVPVLLNPSEALGDGGRETLDVAGIRQWLQGLPEDQRLAVAETQIYTMPYGIKNDVEARARLNVVLEVLPDGALRHAITKGAINFLEFYDWKMATDFKQNRPLDFNAIDAYASPAQGVLSDSAKRVREAHLAVQILDPNSVAGAVSAAQFNVQVLFVRELTDQDLADAIFHGAKNKDISEAAFYRITAQNLLNNIVRNHPDFKFCAAACSNLTDQAMLTDIAIADRFDPGLQQVAVRNLTEQSARGSVALNCKDSGVQLFATQRISDQSLLKLLACSGRTDRRDRLVSITALMRMDDTVDVEAVAADPQTNPAIAAQARDMLNRVSGEQFFKIEMLRFAFSRAEDDDPSVNDLADELLDEAIKFLGETKITPPFRYGIQEALEDLHRRDAELTDLVAVLAADEATRKELFVDRRRRVNALLQDVVLLQTVGVAPADWLAAKERVLNGALL